MPVSAEQIVEALNRHRTSLVGYAWAIAGDAQLADDIYQDVSLAAIKKADQIVDTDHLLPWLRKAVRLRGLELRRQRSGHSYLLSPDVLDLFENTQTELTSATESDRMTCLRHCMDAMPKPGRELLNLRYVHEMKPKAIAEKTGKSDQAIYKALKRLHTLLASCIKQRLKTIGGRG